MLSEVLPDVRFVNIVDDSLLADVMREAKVTPTFWPQSKRGLNPFYPCVRPGGDTIDLESLFSQVLGCVSRRKQMLEKI